MSRSKSFKRNVILSLVICLVLPLAGQSKEKMSRAETMMINLRMGHGSAGFHMLEAIRLQDEVEDHIRKALFQVREVDKTFAKSKGRPDDRYLERAAVKMAQCQDKSKAFGAEIQDTWLILKDCIKDSLVAGAGGD